MSQINWGIALVALGTVALTLGCSDDNTGPAAMGGSDGGMDTLVAAPMCKATFANFNRTTLGMRTNPALKCAAPSDLDVICANDVGGAARSCGQACFGAGAEDSSCNANCVKMTINPSVSDSCLSCYGLAFNCSASNCVPECLPAPKSAACITCQETHGCLSMFYGCSGLPGATPTVDAGGDASQGN